jgi:hypothetical protein
MLGFCCGFFLMLLLCQISSALTTSRAADHTANIHFRSLAPTPARDMHDAAYPTTPFQSRHPQFRSSLAPSTPNLESLPETSLSLDLNDASTFLEPDHGRPQQHHQQAAPILDLAGDNPSGLSMRSSNDLSPQVWSTFSSFFASKPMT